MERAHQTLKSQIAKLRQGEFKYSSLHHVLHHALFVINHLNVDTQGQTAMTRHWTPEGGRLGLGLSGKTSLQESGKGRIYRELVGEGMLVCVHRIPLLLFGPLRLLKSLGSWSPGPRKDGETRSS